MTACWPGPHRAPRFIDSSTIDPHTAREVAAAAARRGHPHGRCAGLRGHRRRRGRHLDLHGRRAAGAFRAASSRCSRTWAATSCIAGARGPGRPPKSATTCCSASRMIGVAEAMSLGDRTRHRAQGARGRSSIQLERPMLEFGYLQSLSRRHGQRARRARLHRRLRHRSHAQGSGPRHRCGEAAGAANRWCSAPWRSSSTRCGAPRAPARRISPPSSIS